MKRSSSAQGGPPPSPESTSSLLSWVTYSWLTPLLFKGAKSKLELADVWGLEHDQRAVRLFEQFEAHKPLAIKAPQTSSPALALMMQLVRMNRRLLIQGAILGIIYTVCLLVQPILVHEVVSAVMDASPSSVDGKMMNLTAAPTDNKMGDTHMLGNGQYGPLR